MAAEPNAHSSPFGWRWSPACRARALARDAAQAERVAHRERGVAWLTTLSDDALKALYADDAACDGAGVGYSDLRAESKARGERDAAVARRAEWDACRALVPNGCILVDPGFCSNEFGGRSRPPNVHYGVRVFSWGGPHGAEDASTAVVAATRGDVGKLQDVAGRVREGSLRVAAPGDVPPEPVLKRFGYDQLGQVRQVDLEGVVTYVCQLEVLNAAGRKIRKKDVVGAALLLARARGEESQPWAGLAAPVRIG